MDNITTVTFDTGILEMFKKVVSERNETTPKKKQAVHYVADVVENREEHSADPIRTRKNIDGVLSYLFNKKKYTEAALFVFGINTGYRCGDCLSFRVKDLFNNGKCIDKIMINEGKTGKPRPVYFNETVKTMLEWIVKHYKLVPENYLFRSSWDRCKKYIDKFIYDDDGSIVDVVTISEEYREDGTRRERAPMKIVSASRNFIEATSILGIKGHFSSHCMRKTFALYIGRAWNEKDEFDAEEDYEGEANALAACTALNHADVNTTISYYMAIDPVRLKRKWLGMNLGLDVVKKFAEKNK